MTRAIPSGSALPWIACVLLAAAAIPACGSQHATCAVCARDECRALAFRVVYADGESIETCCPRCASHAVRADPARRIARLEATDFATGEKLDARTAVYVDGSDYEHCSAPKEERTAPGCCLEMAYDRCLPSLVAFREEGKARAFMERHGGSLKRFEDLHFGGSPGKGGAR